MTTKYQVSNETLKEFAESIVWAYNEHNDYSRVFVVEGDDEVYFDNNSTTFGGSMVLFENRDNVTFVFDGRNDMDFVLEGFDFDPENVTDSDIEEMEKLVYYRLKSNLQLLNV